jgi:DNA topoisomerase VI subunit A
MLDFSQRVSSNEAYPSPTRGRQGNAIQMVLAMPFVLDGVRGETTIESRGVKHTVVFEIDAVRQTPRVSTTRAKGGFVQSGTRVSVSWPVSACLKLADAELQIVQMAEAYAALNLHLSISVQRDGDKVVNIKAANPTWIKWLPGDPTSAHWYDLERFNRLIAATIAHEQDTGGQTLVREFVATFRGMTRSDAQKTVLDKTGTSRMSLAELYSEGKNRNGVATLLRALQNNTKPVKPTDLGVIGREHLEHHCDQAGGDLDTFGYHKVAGTTDGLPWIIEVAFAYCPLSDERRVIAGCNWSPGIQNPFHDLDVMLADKRVDCGAPVVVVMHLACPVLSFADRGKSNLVLPPEIEAAIGAATVKATASWAKQAKAEIRDANARHYRLERMARQRKVSQKDVAYEALPAAYAKVSDNGALPANVRQIYYALRNEVHEKSDKELGYQYFSQTLLPTYIAENEVTWNIAYDDRGHLIEPHTGDVIGLGTLAVREYIAERKLAEVVEAALQEAHVETKGPDGNYGALLYIEKEGFDAVIERVQLRERFDIGVMSCKGMSVTAARDLVAAFCGKNGIPLFVLHDFDKAGLSIAATLSRDTRRYQFEHEVNVTDIGLRMDDIKALRLEPFAEPAANDNSDDETRSENMRLNGATKDEVEFLLEQRIELNALTSRQFIDLLERKLTKHGVKKLVPNVKLLKDTYKAIVRGEYIRAAFEEAVEEAEEEVKAIVVPATIRSQVEAMLKKEPRLRWDQAVAQIARLKQ